MAYDWSGEYVQMKKDEVLVFAALATGAGALVLAAFMLFLGSSNPPDLINRPKTEPTIHSVSTKTAVDFGRSLKSAPRPI
jgi:hypothetical protein